MIGLDTNVLVRIVTNDDPAQARRAADALRQGEVFVSKTVLLEMEWVLRHAYRLGRESIVAAMEKIAGLRNVTVEQLPRVAEAIDAYARGFDFADALHLASCCDADQFVTFDKRFSKLAAQMNVLPVALL